MDAKKEVNAENLLDGLAVDTEFTYKLSREVKVADRVFTEIKVDFSKITGRDLTSSSVSGISMAELDKGFLSQIVVKAANKAGTKININEFLEFPAPDCIVLTMRAQAFLLGAVSQNESK
jgi:hypothetical protein